MYYSLVSFLFSAVFVSVFSTKLIHLFTHASTVSVAAFIFYLPTFFFLDLIAICTARLLLRNERGLLSWVGFAVAAPLTFLLVGGASSQLGFYVKTGGEIEWHEATTFATSKDGLKVLLSGSWAVLACGLVILVIAWFVQNPVYKAFGALLTGAGNQIAFVYRLIRHFHRGKGSPYARVQQDADFDFDSATELSSKPDRRSDDDESEGHTLLGEDEEKPVTRKGKISRWLSAVPSWAVKSAALAFLIFTFIIRPHNPYDHFSITLPISMLDVFKSEPDYCAEQRHLVENPWPLPELIDQKYWKEANGDFKGWAPGAGSPLVEQYRIRTPDWLPEDVPRGFFRWDPKRFKKNTLESRGTASEKLQKGEKAKCLDFEEKEPFYNPVNDPMRITNLDTEVLQPLKEALDDGSVKIKHVVFILMESLREELFPLVQGSDMHEIILKYSDEEDREEVNARLAHLTPHIERITGRAGNFRAANGSTYDHPDLKWNDTTRPGYGGINVQGGFTGATMSTKSFCTNHCGAWVMPVEKFDEAETDSYQPCMPQILELFNQVKEKHSSKQSSDNFHQQEWYPAFFQSVVEEYDRMEIFDEKVGFKHVIAKKQLESDRSRYNASDPLYQKVNYFGYSEPVLKPYITEYIKNATANDQRIWMTHFTSTTHHAWDTPDDFETLSYLPPGLAKWHEDLNKYLNTIRWHDQWMGEIMQLLDDLGISNETLVVMSGDHGQAFEEDFKKTGTYENGHVSNFRVPIVLRHPNLPSIQYQANATTVSLLPTILDLLINSGSLNEKDTTIASDLVHEYEGQSLIRPYKTNENGRRAWNFAVVNSGAGMLAVTSADAPWRMVMPLDKVFEYTVSDLKADPLELEGISEWTLQDIISSVRKGFGPEAAQWVTEAEKVARWWATERKRLWKYHK